ncbi:MAG: hypothetical protein ABMA01_17330 [Chthoniobacteraceae bacterium]
MNNHTILSADVDMTTMDGGRQEKSVGRKGKVSYREFLLARRRSGRSPRQKKAFTGATPWNPLGMPVSQRLDPQSRIGKWWNAGMGFADVFRNVKSRTRSLEDQALDRTEMRRRKLPRREGGTGVFV